MKTDKSLNGDEVVNQMNEALKSVEDVLNWTDEKEINLINGIIADKITLKRLITLGLSCVPAEGVIGEDYYRVAVQELADIDSTIKHFENQVTALIGTSEVTGNE